MLMSAPGRALAHERDRTAPIRKGVTKRNQSLDPGPQACRFILHIVVRKASEVRKACLFSAGRDVGLGYCGGRRIAAPGFGRSIENNRLGLIESLKKPVLDFGLADQPLDDLRFRDVEGLTEIRPVPQASWHETRCAEKLGSDEREHQTTPLTLFGGCHHEGSRRDRPGARRRALNSAIGVVPAPIGATRRPRVA